MQKIKGKMRHLLAGLFCLILCNVLAYGIQKECAQTAQSEAAGIEPTGILFVPQEDGRMTRQTGRLPIRHGEGNERAGGIVFSGNVSYHGYQVGVFTVNGNMAFCLQHEKWNPQTGTSFEQGVYENEDIRKVLYGGLGGDAQWSGFESEVHGRVLTSLALSVYYNGSHYDSSDYIYTTGKLKAFLDYCKGLRVPDPSNLSFSPGNVKAATKENGSWQETSVIQLQADGKNTVTLSLPQHISLWNQATNQLQKGSVKISGGTKFTLRAPAETTGTWSSGSLSGSLGKFQTLVTYPATNSQDLGYGQWVPAPEYKTSLSVQWEDIRGDVTIEKLAEPDLGEETNLPLAGAEFTFTHTKTKEQVTIVTGKDGVASTKTNGYPNGRLRYGIWKVEETKAPEGFLPVEPFEVEIKAQGQHIQKTCIDERIEKQVEIQKLDEKSGRPVTKSPMEFRIYKNGKPLVLDGTEVFLTGADGKVRLPQALTYGAYQLVETKAPYGYQLSQEPVDFFVEQEEKDGGILEVICKNAPLSGRIKVHKMKKGTDQMLPDAVFEVRALEEVQTADGTIHYKKSELVDTLTTTEEGAVSKELPLGAYEVREVVQPEGYVLSEESFYVDLHQEMERILAEGTEVNVPLQVTVQAENEENALLIQKTKSGTTKPLEGISFQIWEEEKIEETMEGQTEVTEDTKEDAGAEIPSQIYKTDKDGKILIRGLKSDRTYYIKEVHTLPGFLLEETTHEVTVAKDGTIEGQVEYTLALENDCTKLQIVKKDRETDQLLKGAHLQIEDRQGNIVVQKWVSAEQPFYLEALQPGNYVLTELMAPEGYQIGEGIPFTLEETVDVQQVVMYNEREKELEEEGDEPRAPKTGDPSDSGWMAVGLLLGTAVLFSVIKRTYSQRKSA